MYQNAKVREELHKQMLSDGYDTQLLDSADMLFNLVSQNPPDLILLDAMMGSGAGPELCGELRMLETARDVPIILVSETMAPDELVAHGLLAGADDYVASGERPIELRARVRVQLRNKRYRDALQRVRGEREAFRRQAGQDALTGLLNRRSLANIISEKVNAAEPFGVSFMDIDHFKFINDRFGHAMGDQVLKSVADCLRRGMRSGDYCGRYGGEEFVMVVPPCTNDQAYRMGERHRLAVAALTHDGLDGHQVTISVGIAIYDPAEGETSDDILEEADAALYAAKITGRNRVVMAKEAVGTSQRPSRVAPPPEDEKEQLLTRNKGG